MFIHIYINGSKLTSPTAEGTLLIFRVDLSMQDIN